MTSDELYQIYEEFTEQIINQGWKGKHFGWTETVRCEVDKDSWSLFELDNGFCLGLREPNEQSNEPPVLEYWFENESDEEEDEKAVAVHSLEQLLELLN